MLLRELRHGDLFEGIQSNISPNQFKLNLSKCITKETAVYEELRECIFERA